MDRGTALKGLKAGREEGKGERLLCSQDYLPRGGKAIIPRTINPFSSATCNRYVSQANPAAHAWSQDCRLAYSVRISAASEGRRFSPLPSLAVFESPNRRRAIDRIISARAGSNEQLGGIV